MQRRDADLLKALRGVPWQPVPGGDAGDVAEAARRPPAHVAAEPLVGPDELPPPAVGKAFVRRNLYVKKEDIEKYGQTVGCPGCIAIAARSRMPCPR